jgi:hypothetical protein
VNWKVAPLFKILELNVANFIVWGAESSFSQVTVVPDLIVIVPGEKAKFLIEIVLSVG